MASFLRYTCRMQTDAAGLQNIRDEEGIVLKVQGDTGGHQEIGYGHDLKAGEEFPNGITTDTAEFLLTSDVSGWVDPAIAAMVKARGWVLNQNQWNALSDFTYEDGAAALTEMTAHGLDQVPLQLARWIHARIDGVERSLPGMMHRRANDIALWLKPISAVAASGQ